ncbi:MAG TPA: twin-arginine translocase subunit TatC [Candidatus Azoamicus sp.]
MNTHFIELRERLIYCFLFFINIFIVLFYYSDIIYDLFSIPIKYQLPKNSGIIATQITSTFLVPLTLSINISLICSAPYFIFQIWSFISPGLYKNEKNAVMPFILISILLFFLGILFAFYIICPIALNFFMTCSPSNVTIMISINNYMEFMFTIMLACGLSFQIPIIINLIIKTNIISKNTLREKRSYVFISAFVLGMLLTPPDVISQITLAIPIWLLFELGLVFSK